MSLSSAPCGAAFSRGDGCAATRLHVPNADVTTSIPTPAMPTTPILRDTSRVSFQFNDFITIPHLSFAENGCSGSRKTSQITQKRSDSHRFHVHTSANED